MGATDSEEGIVSELDGATAVLVLSPALGAESDRICTDLLTRTDPAEEHLLYVTFNESADDRLAAWREHVGDAVPATTGVISVGEESRVQAESMAWPDGSPISVETLSSPTDLTGLAMRMGSVITRWQRDDRTPVVCVHSLTTLLQYADLDRVYRFVHATTDRLESCGAIAHFHMTEDAHSARELSTIASLFDAAVRVEDDGSWEIQTR